MLNCNFEFKLKIVCSDIIFLLFFPSNLSDLEEDLSYTTLLTLILYAYFWVKRKTSFINVWFYRTGIHTTTRLGFGIHLMRHSITCQTKKQKKERGRKRGSTSLLFFLIFHHKYQIKSPTNI